MYYANDTVAHLALTSLHSLHTNPNEEHLFYHIFIFENDHILNDLHQTLETCEKRKCQKFDDWRPKNILSKESRADLILPYAHCLQQFMNS